MSKRKWSIVLIVVVVFVLATFAPAMAEPPECQGAYSFSYTREYAPSDWTLETHSYVMRFRFDSGDQWSESDPVYFEVEASAPLIDGQVQLRALGLVTNEGDVDQINPDQDTVMQLSVVYSEPATMSDAKSGRDAIETGFSVDGGAFEAIPAGPLTSACAFLNPAKFDRTWGPSY